MAEFGRSQAAVHNLAILEHYSLLEEGNSAPVGHALDTAWEHAFASWRETIFHDDVWAFVKDRIRAIDDPRLPTSFARELRTRLADALVSINTTLAKAALKTGQLDVLRAHATAIMGAGLARERAESVVREIVEPETDALQKLCDAGYADAIANPQRAAECASRILTQAAPRLQTIAAVLPSTDSTDRKSVV